ncbi:MAG: type II secretion system F family protein [Baekduia sp.]
MATYVFKAMDAAGSKAAGEIEAETKQAVADQLRQRGLIVLDIADKGGSKEIELPFFNKTKAADLTIMTRQLATMVNSGMTILRALYILETQTENKKLAGTIGEIRKDVEAGIALSDAFERHPDTFNQLFTAMTRAGETGGMLDQALLRIADQLESADSLRRQVKSAMAYPIVVLSFSVMVLIALLVWLVPVFENVFKTFGGELPAITRMTVSMSNAMTSYWYIVMLVAGGAWYGFKKWKATEGGRQSFDKFKLRVPMKIGDIVQKVALARWSRTLSGLVTAGVPLMQAIEITGKTSGNWVVEKAMDDVVESVRSGGTIADPLKNSPVFPGMVTHMVSVGEDTGALDTMLTKIAEFYEDQVAAAVKQLTSILEPIMIILVGGMVGFIVVAMYMPMFKVYDSIK